MFGLTHDAVRYVLEQLPGAKYCHNHRFKYFKYDVDDEDSVSGNVICYLNSQTFSCISVT